MASDVAACCNRSSGPALLGRCRRRSRNACGRPLRPSGAVGSDRGLICGIGPISNGIRQFLTGPIERVCGSDVEVGAMVRFASDRVRVLRGGKTT
jgi:hypothetical protein